MKTRILALAALFCACVHAQNIQRVLLANTVASTSTTQVYVYSTVIPSSLSQGYIYIDSEAMQVTQAAFAQSAVNNLVLLTVKRAILSTTAATHVAGVTSFYGFPYQFILADLSGGCNAAGPQYINAADQMLFSCGPNNQWARITTVLGGGGGTPGDGTVTQVAVTTPLTGGPITSSGTLGIQQASASQAGYLSAADYSTFTGKQTAITWPPTGDLVLSNSSSSPGGLAPINGDCVVGSGGAWTAATCPGGGGALSYGPLSSRPTTPATPTQYLATDQPRLSEMNWWDGNFWTFFNIDASGLTTNGGTTLGVDHSIIGCLACANDNTALNRFAGVAGIGSSPGIANGTGTMAVNTGSTNVAGTLTSSTSGTVTFTLTWASLTYAHRAVCQFTDETTPSDLVHTVQATAPTTTTLTAAGNTASGDIVSYSCSGY